MHVLPENMSHLDRFVKGLLFVGQVHGVGRLGHSLIPSSLRSSAACLIVPSNRSQLLGESAHNLLISTSYLTIITTKAY